MVASTVDFNQTEGKIEKILKEKTFYLFFNCYYFFNSN